MPDYFIGSAAELPVRLLDSSGAAVTGVAFGVVGVTLRYADGTFADVTVTGGNWIELGSSNFIGSGCYTVTVPLGQINKLGELLYVVKATGAKTFTNYVRIVPVNSGTPYVEFVAGGTTSSPNISRVSSPNRVSVQITYSAAMKMDGTSSGALNIANYSIVLTATGSPLSITSVTPVDASTVLLQTANQTPGSTYSLSISNVQDLNGNVVT